MPNIKIQIVEVRAATFLYVPSPVFIYRPWAQPGSGPAKDLRCLSDTTWLLQPRFECLAMVMILMHSLFIGALAACMGGLRSFVRGLAGEGLVPKQIAVLRLRSLDTGIYLTIH